MPASKAIEPKKRPRGRVLWVNPLDLVAGDASVTTTSNAVDSGVGGGLAGLVVHSSTTGEDAQGGGNKVVWMGLQIPPGWRVVGVRVCYELSSARSFISQIRLDQLQDPPATAVVLLDDPTDLVAVGPVCVNSQSTDIDPRAGAIFISFRVNFGRVGDAIVIRGVGIRLKAA
jgi:hypothetical protein